jgi:prophage regulatory protein
MGANKEAALHGRRLLTGTAVQAKTSLSRPTIWRLIRAGNFPASVKVSPGRVAWDADAVEAWIAARVGGNTAEAA